MSDSLELAYNGRRLEGAATPTDAFIDAIAEKVVEKLGERSEPSGGVVWLTVEQAAKHIQRDYREVYRMIREGEIPSHRASERYIRIAQRELDEWLLGR